MRFRKGTTELSLFTTIATLGDHIEAFLRPHPLFYHASTGSSSNKKDKKKLKQQQRKETA